MVIPFEARERIFEPNVASTLQAWFWHTARACVTQRLIRRTSRKWTYGKQKQAAIRRYIIGPRNRRPSGCVDALDICRTILHTNRSAAKVWRGISASYHSASMWARWTWPRTMWQYSNAQYYPAQMNSQQNRSDLAQLTDKCIRPVVCVSGA